MVKKSEVVLSAGNIAHYHHAALALQNAGRLQRYLCTFSGRETDAWWGRLLPLSKRKRLQGKHVPGLDLGLVQAIPAPYIATQALCRINLIGGERASAWFNAWYDHASRRYAEQAGVFHYVETMGLDTAIKIKRNGGKTICDVRSAHIDARDAILRTEYSRLGLPYQSMDGCLRERMLEEQATANVIIVPSDYVAETFVQQGISRSKLFVVPYGANLPNFTTRQQRRPMRSTERPFRILFVGQILPLKGLHYLIEAFVKLNLPQSELLIFGRGEPAYQELLHKMMPPGESRIKFLGHVPQVDLWRYYQESDVFVLPTLCEGSALVVYEAMAAGLPVITTPNAGAVVRNELDGFVVPVCDAAAIAEKLSYFYRYPEARQRMGEAAATQSKEFTWVRYGERLMAVYQEIDRRESVC